MAIYTLLEHKDKVFIKINKGVVLRHSQDKFVQSPYEYSEWAGRASRLRALRALRLRGPGTFPGAKQSPAPAPDSQVK